MSRRLDDPDHIDDPQLDASDMLWLRGVTDYDEATLQRLAAVGQRLGLNLHDFQAPEVWKQLIGEELATRKKARAT